MKQLLHTSRMAILWLLFSMCLHASSWAKATTDIKNVYVVYDQSKSFKNILNNNDVIFFDSIHNTLKKVYNDNEYNIIYHKYGEALYLNKLHLNKETELKNYLASSLIPIKDTININISKNKSISYTKEVLLTDTLLKNSINNELKEFKQNNIQIKIEHTNFAPPIVIYENTIKINLYKNLLLALDGIMIKEKDKSNFKVIIVSDGLITNPIEGEDYKAKVTAALRNLEVMTNTNVFAIHINKDTTNHYFNFKSSEFNSHDSFIKESSHKLWISNSKFTDKNLIKTVIPSLSQYLRRIKFMAHESVLIPNKNNDTIINYLNYLYVKNAINDTIKLKQSDSLVKKYRKNIIHLKNKTDIKSDSNLLNIVKSLHNLNKIDTVYQFIKVHGKKLDIIPQIAFQFALNEKSTDTLSKISDSTILKYFYTNEIDSIFTFKDAKILEPLYNILNDSSSIISYSQDSNTKFLLVFNNIPELIEENNAVGQLAYKYLNHEILDAILRKRIVDYNLPKQQIDYQVKFLSQFIEQKNQLDKKIDVMINPRIVQKASNNLEENIILGLTSYIIDRSKNEIIFSLVENINELFSNRDQLKNYFHNTHIAINEKKVKDVNDLKKFITLDYVNVWNNLAQDSLIKNKEILPTIAFIDGFTKAIKKNEGNIFASFNTMAKNWNIKDRLASVVNNSIKQNDTNSFIGLSYKNVNQFIEQDFKFYLLANILGTNSQFDLFKLNDQKIDDAKSFTTLFINNTINKYKDLLKEYDTSITKYCDSSDLIDLNRFEIIDTINKDPKHSKYVNIRVDSQEYYSIIIDSKSIFYEDLSNIKSDNHFYVLTNTTKSKLKNNTFHIYKPKDSKSKNSQSLILLESRQDWNNSQPTDSAFCAITEYEKEKFDYKGSIKIFFSKKSKTNGTSQLITINKKDDNYYSVDSLTGLNNIASKIIAFSIKNIDRNNSLADYYKEINEEVYHIKNKLIRLEEKRKAITNLNYDDLQKIETEYGKELRNVWANLMRLGVNKSLVSSNHFSSTKINSDIHKNMVNIIDLWEDINNSDYEGAINNIIPILRNNININSNKKSNDSVINTKLQRRMDLFFNIAAEIPSCKSSEEIKQIITKYTLPVASYKAKKEYNTIMITAYPGINYIHKPQIDGIKNDIVLSIPIGIEYSFLINRDKNKHTRNFNHYKHHRSLNFSVMLSLLDLGNVLPYYINPPKGINTTTNDYTLSFENLYSPGLLFNFGFTKRIPLNLQVGYMFNPQRFSAGLSLDLPLFGIWKN